MTMLGTHVASLNLFLESDGTYEITIASAATDTIADTPDGLRPIDHVENLILAAANLMERRKLSDGTFRIIDVAKDGQ